MTIRGPVDLVSHGRSISRSIACRRPSSWVTASGGSSRKAQVGRSEPGELHRALTNVAVQTRMLVRGLRGEVGSHSSSFQRLAALLVTLLVVEGAITGLCGCDSPGSGTSRGCDPERRRRTWG